MTKEETKEQRDSFFEALRCLPRGRRVALKRAAGRPMSEASNDALLAFMECLPSGIDKNMDIWFAAGAFSCRFQPEDAARAESLPCILRKMQTQKELSASYAARILTLLGTQWSLEGTLLRQIDALMRRVQQREYVVDCAQLLWDLERWNWTSRPVQFAWIRELAKAAANETE